MRPPTQIQRPRPTAWLLLASVLAIGSGCTNSNRSNFQGALKGKSPTAAPSAEPAVAFTIATAQLASGASDVQVFFSTTGAAASRSIREFCSLATPLCSCQFSWDETNNTGATDQKVPRKVLTRLTSVQPSMVSCQLPSVYASEIPNSTLVKLTVLPAAGNPGGFTVSTYTLTKGNITATGNFQDAEGRRFQNIFRYSCFEQNLRGVSLASKKVTTTFTKGSTTEDRELLLASQFCKSRGRTGAGSDVDGCQTQLAGSVQQSAQTYYYNLYVRSTDLGSINSENAAFTCPEVAEPLFDSATNPGNQRNFYPLDSTFALALLPQGTFSIGVEARSRISVAGDPNSVDTPCTPSSASNGGSASTSSDRMVVSCLGYAARPNANGTCPKFVDSNGQTHLTFRLRRYTALYPVLWDTTGANMPNEGAKTDQVYVLDRPVYDSAADPLQPYTMRGPKPCPFAWYDWKGVTSSPATYVSTNNTGWDRVNPDGIQFPNTDRYTPGIGYSSCSSVLPVVTPDRSMVSLATLHASNPVFQMRYVRPGNAWAPTYLEDTSFEACAPDSVPHRDAPIHIAKNSTTGNFAWCAEAYPNYNSILQKGTDQTTNGVASTRRTVLRSQSGYARYPLLASGGKIEEALRNDSTYSCLMTYDNQSSSLTKVANRSPAGSCCKFSDTLLQNRLEPNASNRAPCLVPGY